MGSLLESLNLPMVRSGTLIAGWLLSLTAGAMPLRAEYEYPGANEVREDDVRQFMESLAWEMRGCHTDAIADHFVPNGSVLLVKANGQQERLRPSEYAKLRRFCRPYRLIRWDGSHNEVSYSGTGSGNVATVRWRLEWGGQEPGRNGNPIVQFENWIELIKTGNRLRVVRAGERAREFVPGGEETFYMKTEAGDVMYPLMKVSTTIGRAIAATGAYIGRLVTRKPVPHQDNSLTAAHGIH